MGAIPSKCYGKRRNESLRTNGKQNKIIPNPPIPSRKLCIVSIAIKFRSTRRGDFIKGNKRCGNPLADNLSRVCCFLFCTVQAVARCNKVREITAKRGNNSGSGLIGRDLVTMDTIAEGPPLRVFINM